MASKVFFFFIFFCYYNRKYCKFGDFPRLPSLLIPTASSRVPKTTLRFNNLLEGLTELTEGYCAYGYSGRIQIKINHGKSYMEQSPRELQAGSF